MEITLFTPAHIEQETPGRKIVEKIEEGYCTNVFGGSGFVELPGFENVKNWDGLMLTGSHIRDQIYGNHEKNLIVSMNLHFLGSNLDQTILKQKLQRFCFDLEVSSKDGVMISSCFDGVVRIIFRPKNSKLAFELNVDVSVLYENYAQVLYSESRSDSQYGWNGKEFFSTTLAINSKNAGTKDAYTSSTSDPLWVKTIKTIRHNTNRDRTDKYVIKPDYVCDLSLEKMVTWKYANEKYYKDNLRKISKEEADALRNDGIMELFEELYQSHPERALMLAEARLKKQNESKF